jgi:hypothetical protein
MIRIIAECAGCMADEVICAPCDPECLISQEHLHLHCVECDYEWTEPA